MKELGLLFGNTAYSSATTLATFFLGLTMGGYFWGQRAAELNNPLLTYGLLELAVAISVIGCFQIHDAYQAFYPSIFENFGHSRWIFTIVKFFLSLLLLFPPAFFIGGTLPVMSQFLVQNRDLLAQQVSSLYAVNTFGAAVGSLLAGFYLPRVFGFQLSYWVAIGTTVVIGMIALVLAFRWPRCSFDKGPRSLPVTNISKKSLIPLSSIRLLAVVSGFGTLCLQVLWTRMFAQVLQNSVYTFATILFIFLLSLSSGAVAANWIIRKGQSPSRALFWLFTAGALMVAMTPFFFNAWTDGLRYIGAGEGWNDYLIQVVKVEISIIALPVFILGTNFPLLLKLAEPWGLQPGQLVGQLAALNTAGAILGSLVGGFILLQTIGLRAGIRLIGMIYLMAGMVLLYMEEKRRPLLIGFSMTGILLVVSVLEPGRLPLLRIDPVADNESLLEIWESGSGTVAVVRRDDSLRIKVNNYYTLGGSGSKDLEKVEAHLPVLLHSNPKSVFFLGLGTGISAGAVLDFPVQRLVVSELIPEVVLASKKYFGEFNNRLFFDPRAHIYEDDGRNFLAGTREKFDLVIADLFIPWRSGAGSLYTLEHYLAVRNSLNKRGSFMQWLPTYQLSRDELGTIVRTLTQVFPHVTLWRGGFSSRKPVVGLWAQLTDTRLKPDKAAILENDQHYFGERVPLLAHYIGNIGLLADEFTAFPINSDDRPEIEYQAPITQQRQKKGDKKWMVGDELIQFMDYLQQRQPLETDPYLKNVSNQLRKMPEAGMYLHRAQVLRANGQISAAKASYEQFNRLRHKTDNESIPMNE